MEQGVEIGGECCAKETRAFGDNGSQEEVCGIKTITDAANHIAKIKADMVGILQTWCAGQGESICFADGLLTRKSLGIEEEWFFVRAW